MRTASRHLERAPEPADCCWGCRLRFACRADHVVVCGLCHRLLPIRFKIINVHYSTSDMDTQLGWTLDDAGETRLQALVALPAATHTHSRHTHHCDARSDRALQRVVARSRSWEKAQASRRALMVPAGAARARAAPVCDRKASQWVKGAHRWRVHGEGGRCSSREARGVCTDPSWENPRRGRWLVGQSASESSFISSMHVEFRSLPRGCTMWKP